MNEFTFSPSGVCSQQIEIEIQGDTVKRIQFKGGCKVIHKVLQDLPRA